MVALQGSWKSKPWLKQERVHLLLVQQMMTPIHSPQNRRTCSRFSHFLASQMPCKAISMLGSHPHFKETSQCSFEAKAKRNTTSKPTNKTTGKDWLIKHSSFSLITLPVESAEWGQHSWRYQNHEPISKVGRNWWCRMCLTERSRWTKHTLFPRLVKTEPHHSGVTPDNGCISVVHRRKKECALKMCT